MKKLEKALNRRMRLRKSRCPKREDFDSKSAYQRAYKKWQVNNNILAKI